MKALLSLIALILSGLLYFGRGILLELREINRNNKKWAVKSGLEEEKEDIDYESIESQKIP